MKNLHWLPEYIKRVNSQRYTVHGRRSAVRHLIFCMVDHFEPFGYPQVREKNMQRLDKWINDYPESIEGLKDSDGNPVRHSLFCAAEDYAPDYMNKLQSFCRAGYGEVEIHLHHRNDTQENFKRKLITFRDQLHNAHGMLGVDKDGNPCYGFIHGNWALCNSRSDHDWCGVNEELSILKDTGCYADLTFPSAPDSSQPRLVNSIYYAKDNPAGCGADSGVIAEAGVKSPPESLMIITGPLALNWHLRKYGILPRIENSDISGSRLPSPQRLDLWVKQNIHVIGRPDWVFVKVHTHGMVPENGRVLFGDVMRKTYEYMQEIYNDGKEWLLHYVTAREMYNILSAAEEGEVGKPGQYRDYKVGRPVF